MKHIDENFRLKFEAKAFRFTLTLISAVIGGIVLITIVLRLFGISTDNVGW
ncbi:MAG: hypothetical protein ACHQD9_02310 [Chitinophagales bacterium]